MFTKRTAAFALAVLLAALALFACDETGHKDTLSQGNLSETESLPQTESSEEALVPQLADADVNVRGFELKIFTSKDSRPYTIEQFVGYIDDDGKTDPISVAVYERNAKMEQEYGFTITYEMLPIGFNEYLTRVRNDAASDTADYHVLANGSTVIAPLTVEGYCYDLYNLENSCLSLCEDWWDPVTQRDMSIGNHLYMVAGDIMVLDDQFTYAMFFNKDIADDYNFDPYKLVYDGKWTMDKMHEMMIEVAHSGGDGIMDVENGDDTWGMVGVAFDTYQLIMGGGKAQVYKDENDLPVFAMAEEPNVNNFLKVMDIVTDKNITALKEFYYAWDNPEGQKVANFFYNGQALFYPATVYAVSGEKMRNAEIHYGILPMPKYNEEQGNYASTIDPYHFFVLAIPTNNTDNLDKITFCLEAMAYLARETVTGAYYEVTLKLKRFANDDDSPEMLDIIFRNRLVDISVIFNWGDCIQYYNRLLGANNRGIKSFCEANIDVFNTAMQETIDTYKMLEGY